MRHFDSRKDGQVSYNEFCDALPLVQRSQFEVSSLEIKVEKDAKNGGAKNFRLDPDWTTAMLQTRAPLDEALL